MFLTTKAGKSNKVNLKQHCNACTRYRNVRKMADRKMCFCSEIVESFVFPGRIRTTTPLSFRPNWPSVPIAWPSGPGPRTEKSSSGPTGRPFGGYRRRTAGPLGLKGGLGAFSLARWARLCELLVLWAETQQLRILPQYTQRSRQDAATAIRLGYGGSPPQDSSFCRSFFCRTRSSQTTS